MPDSLLRMKQDVYPPSLLGTRETFISLIKDLSYVYVVLDALDECPELMRQGALSFITGLVTAPITCHVKVFVTSRREMDITKVFEDAHIPTIQIQAENVAADIETFARNQVVKLRQGDCGKTLYVTNNNLEEKIIHTLATKADGM